MKERLPFIDWMKALGMLVIIYGHAPAGGLLELTEPFNPKQLGVAFFIFVLGYSLAGETRPVPRVLLNRLFEIFLWGFAAALVMSVVGLITRGDPAESNYLPFAFGINVLVNYFPANATTWYIGMYLHMVLLWALVVRRFKVTAWMLLAALGVEILIRFAILEAGRYHIAYMLVSNWITIFLLGRWYGQNWPQAKASAKALPAYLVAVLALLLAWPRFAAIFDPEVHFPWNFFQLDGGRVSLLLTSTAISFLYLAYTWLIFQISVRLGDYGVVRFFARNTLIVFIAHLPLVTAWSPTIYEAVPAIWLRLVINLLLYFVALSLLSELIRRVVPTMRLRELLGARLLQSPSTSI